jgi:hypothetical protein
MLPSRDSRLGGWTPPTGPAHHRVVPFAERPAGCSRIKADRPAVIPADGLGVPVSCFQHGRHSAYCIAISAQNPDAFRCFLMPACAFCCTQHASLSGEHVWSEWMGKLFGPALRRRFHLRQFDRTGAMIREVFRPRIDLQAPVICADCNNQWLSDLENRYAKPLMSRMILPGAAVSLDALGIVTITSWAFKTAVIIDQLTTRRRPFFRPAARQAFMRDLSIPDGVQIWLAEYGTRTPRRGHFTTHYLRPRTTPRLKGFEFYVLTFMVGRLAFQVLSPRWASRLPRRRSMPLLTHIPEWNAATVRTWPNDNTIVTWPPPEPITDGLLDQFTYRWARIPLQE